MRIIQVDQQARAVVNLVLGTALFITGLVILLYRLFEPSQLQIYHSLSSSMLVATMALGIAILFYDLHGRSDWQALTSRVLGVVAILASVDGFLGSLFDSFDAQMHPSLYVATAIAGLWLTLRLKSQTAIRLQRFLASGAVLMLVIVLVSHFVFETPFMAKHPVGSLVASAIVMMTAFALWNLSAASDQELPNISI